MILHELFYLRRSDRQVILALLVVIVAALGVIWLAGGDEETPAGVSADSLATASLTDTLPNTSHGRQPYYQVGRQRAELFPFDPNTADSTQLLRLGLQPWQVRNIYKYRAAGGIYRKKEDFARLYGLTVGQYRALAPYIRIGSDYQPAALAVTASANATQADSSDRPHYPEKLKEAETIDLNEADTTLLQRVPGIGPYYARRVADYRQRLGGYVSTGQLDEIEGFPQDAKTYFTIANPRPRRLNVNQLTLNELKRHPYISYYQAKAIVDYRRLKGRIQHLSDLQPCRDFPPESISRLEPYVEY